MDRRLFIASAVAAPLFVAARADGADPESPKKGIFVPSGKGQDKEPLKLAGVIPTDIKVSTKDSGGNLLSFEHTDMGKGGPHRHMHSDQDEWFYVVKGEFAFEVGDERFRLKTGDSVFAPRKVPHVWACVSDKPGTLLLGLSPAGTFETFLRHLAKLKNLPMEEEAGKLFAAHGMKIVGPPLKID